MTTVHGVRVKLDPVLTPMPNGSQRTEACVVGLTRFGQSTAPLGSSPAEIEFFAVATPSIRTPSGDPPESFAKLSGTLTVSDIAAPTFEPGAEAEQPDLSDVFENEGHRWPRRKFQLRLDPALAPGDFAVHELLLPDSAQLEHGYLEVTVTLSIAGSVHATEIQNDVLDVLLLPLIATHAIVRLVDEMGESRAGVKAIVKESDGNELEVEADEHGEVFLPAPNRERYEFVRLMFDGDDGPAPVATRLFPTRSPAV